MMSEIENNERLKNYKVDQLTSLGLKLSLIETIESELERFQEELKCAKIALVDKRIEISSCEPGWCMQGNIKGTRTSGDVKRAAMTLERKLLKFRRGF